MSLPKKEKNHQINKLQMEAIMLLNQQQALLLSEVRSICGQTLCYRLDIVHAQKAMSYYVATCHASALPTHLKRPMRYANRFLLWHNFMYLKQQGFVLYDMGELTDIETVRQFKLSFGGQVVNVYSGYIAHSRISALLLGVQKWRK
ncbi:BioF2-like acetyltransferase domain-containing protein OS=Lysinibacillus sphaericus OX=1421 GN=LS41612_05030 PE=4 SV=1 [Lysinibacillus sphaericus]